tara:strand:+ start:288 stop:674 length:387 start_codon:yes stop_codon:yes gene_type:complete
MGRYYNGDIEGKFWFGVQSSTDADYFGVQGHTSHLNYYFQESDKEAVKKGISDCERYLNSYNKNYKKKLDDFFDKAETYNNEKLMPILGTSSEKDIKRILEWYARLLLGEEILKCIEEKGECSFEAEL